MHNYLYFGYSIVNLFGVVVVFVFLFKVFNEAKITNSQCRQMGHFRVGLSAENLAFASQCVPHVCKDFREHYERDMCQRILTVTTKMSLNKTCSDLSLRASILFM